MPQPKTKSTRPGQTVSRIVMRVCGKKEEERAETVSRRSEGGGRREVGRERGMMKGERGKRRRA
eukprot:1850005-Rhodomonas_salina.3